MNKYAELRQRQQEEFNALPLGFAFSIRQFNEMMKGWGLDPEKDRNKIYRLPGGGYVQKKRCRPAPPNSRAPRCGIDSGH